MTLSLHIGRGFPYPLGPSFSEDGVNFAFYASEKKQYCSVILYAMEQGSSFMRIPLDRSIHRTGDIWHVMVKNLSKPFNYSLEIDGELLIDPYATSLHSGFEWGKSFYHSKKSVGYCYKPFPFDWEGDRAPLIPFKNLIIYEMHVRGFTRDPSSHVKAPGSFKGVMEKIPYLKELGVNAIQLLPIMEFDENEVFSKDEVGDRKLYNYWGYSTVNFFSLMNRYGSTADPIETVSEFKTLVRECHKNGIEVILDVVYNHTCEGNERGRTLSFRGFDPEAYYLIAPDGRYLNYSGCGNTFNCNHSIASALILNSLKYWVTEMHIDGFRFDLASILTRDQQGIPLNDPPIIEAICKDPILTHVKLIAEPWDASGLYQLGGFPSYGRWAEWNGRYRDVVRSFIKGSDNQAGLFAESICGSEDLYGKDRKPYHSINFICCHDGFTLQDLVSYNEKHNLSNGQENQDGIDNNCSWNCGEEGVTTHPTLLRLRERQRKNFFFALMVSTGTPMFLMGDEYGRTKEGNNNSWCQDNHLNWFQWAQCAQEKSFFRFCRLLIQFRKGNPLFCRDEFLTARDIDWHGYEPFSSDWNSNSHFVAYTLKNQSGEEALYAAFNADNGRPSIQLPPLASPHKKWHRLIDTALASPYDILENPQNFPYSKPTYKLEAYSSIALIAL